MKFTHEEILDLLTADGGKFGVSHYDEAFKFCMNFTFGHYENFPVASLLLPKRIRSFIAAIYTFARIGDDIADESNDTGVNKCQQLQQLDSLVEVHFPEITSFEKTQLYNPLALALAETIHQTGLEKKLLFRLTEAFRADAMFHPFSTWQEVLGYCNNSANPVGEIVLYLNGELTPESKLCSDDICTGLQLINFWQDLSHDLPRNRLYIPDEVLSKYGISSEKHSNSEILQYFRENEKISAECMNELCNFAENFFQSGKKIVSLLSSRRLKFELALTIAGGMTILQLVRNQRHRIFWERPTISIKRHWLLLGKNFFYTFITSSTALEKKII